MGCGKGPYFDVWTDPGFASLQRSCGSNWAQSLKPEVSGQLSDKWPFKNVTRQNILFFVLNRLEMEKICYIFKFPEESILYMVTDYYTRKKYWL